MFNSKTIPYNEPIEVQDAGYLRILSLYPKQRYWGRLSSHLLHLDTGGTVGIVETCIHSETGHCQGNMTNSMGMTFYFSLPIKPMRGRGICSIVVCVSVSSSVCLTVRLYAHSVSFYSFIHTSYGMVMSVRPPVRVSIRPSVTVFRTFLLHSLTYWAKICLWLCLTVLQINFECRQFASNFVGAISSNFVGAMPLLGLRILEIHSFPH